MKETSEIYGQMKDELERNTGVSLASGGDMALRLYAVATELESLWAQVEWTKNQCFPQTATGELLDLHAKARALERTSSVSATGVIRFETDEARSENISVPLGTVCLNAGGLEFATTEVAAIKAGELFCLAPAVCKTAGRAGNVPAQSEPGILCRPAGQKPRDRQLTGAVARPAA